MRMTVPTMLAATFVAGYLCGSLPTSPADAQVGDMIKGAAQSGSLGSVGELGSSIVDMEKHVNGLQKNLDTLKKVKAALGG
jgi:hypothetical protein